MKIIMYMCILRSSTLNVNLVISKGQLSS